MSFSMMGTVGQVRHRTRPGAKDVRHRRVVQRLTADREAALGIAAAAKRALETSESRSFWRKLRDAFRTLFR